MEGLMWSPHGVTVRGMTRKSVPCYQNRALIAVSKLYLHGQPGHTPLRFFGILPLPEAPGAGRFELDASSLGSTLKGRQQSPAVPVKSLGLHSLWLHG